MKEPQNFEFAPNGNFVREIGQGLSGFLFGQVVCVDSQDNIRVADEGSDMVIKFNPEGRVRVTRSDGHQRSGRSL